MMHNTPHVMINIAGYDIYTLFDGDIRFDAEKLFSVVNPETGNNQSIATQKINIPVNVFLLIGNGKKILIDTGAGENFGPLYQSQLLVQMSFISINPEEITDIYLTHVHNDHTGGLILNNERVFKNAMIHLHENELQYWLNKTNLKRARTDVLSPNKKSFINAQKALSPYLDNNQIQTFNSNTNFPKGFTLVEMFGHTPGHSLFQISDPKCTLIFCADMVHSSELQFKNPNLQDGFDIDKDKGLVERLRFYSEMADSEIHLAGNHLPYPGLGRLIKEGNSYVFVPMNRNN